MIQYEADVAVVGSGIGGISAAYHCQKAGLDTLVLEASKGFGPAMDNVNGVFAVGTDYQRSKHMNVDKKEIFTFLMDHAHWKNDARQVSEFVNRSGEIWSWLESLGCRAEELVAYNIKAPHTWHYFNDKDAPRLEIIGKTYLENGGRLADQVYVDGLIMENGACVGVTGKTEADEPFEVHCKAVVLATGEPKPIGGPMMAPPPGGKERPYGIGLAAAVGAAQREGTYTAFNMNVKPREYDGPDKPSLGPTEQYFRQPQELMVNRDGVRFTNEEIIHAMEDGASAIASQPGGIIYAIFDDHLHDYWKKWGWSSYKYRYHGEGAPMEDFEEQWQLAKSKGFGLYDATSIPELAEEMGVDPAVLTATVEEYNRVCASGRDTVFFKDSENLIPLVGPRYYAIKVYGIFGQAEGPLAANWKGEILDQDSHPIPGLYGAGGAISDLNGRVYTHICAGSRSMFGLVSGQICGEVIPEYIKTL
jgi:fumarate reductase flavoprotein subunit